MELKLLIPCTVIIAILDLMATHESPLNQKIKYLPTPFPA